VEVAWWQFARGVALARSGKADEAATYLWGPQGARRIG